MYYYSVKTPPWIGGVCESFMRWGNGCRVRGSGFRVSPWGGAAFDYVRKRFGGFNRFRGFNGGGAAHKIRKRRPIISHFQFLIPSNPIHTFLPPSRRRLHYWKASRGRLLPSRSSMHSPRQIPKASWTASTHHYCRCRRS